MDRLWDQEKANQLIPDYMHGGLRRWIEHGIVPGSFLSAVLKNDLAEAVGQADGTNINFLPGYVRYLYNYAPKGCWGSEDKFHEWAAYHRGKMEEGDDESLA